MIEELTQDPKQKFVREMGSPTPKTDQQILLCFTKSRNLVRSWSVCFLISILVGVFLYLHLTSKLIWDKTTIWTVGGVLMGCSTGVGAGFNAINLFGLRATCQCLQTCGDAKTIRFMYVVKLIRFWTILDTIFIFLPPLKIFTTCMIKYHNLRLRPMLRTLEKGYRVY